MSNEAAQVVPVSNGNVNLTLKEIDRFWSNVNKNGPVPDRSIESYKDLEQCWVWTSGKDRDGYGQARLNGKGIRSHRASYIIHNGKIESGMCILHRCDNPSCVRPDHLWAGTMQDNFSDMIAKGRHGHGDTHSSRTRIECRPRGKSHFNSKHPEMLQGEKNGFSKLSEQDVTEIRRLYSSGEFSQKNLGIMFGVCQAHISDLVRKRRGAWKHLP